MGACVMVMYTILREGIKDLDSFTQHLTVWASGDHSLAKLSACQVLQMYDGSCDVFSEHGSISHYIPVWLGAWFQATVQVVQLFVGVVRSRNYEFVKVEQAYGMS